MTAGTILDIFDLDALTEQLAELADWKDELAARIERRKLQLLADLAERITVTRAAWLAEIEPLGTEVESFARVCRVLVWRAEEMAA